MARVVLAKLQQQETIIYAVSALLMIRWLPVNTDQVHEQIDRFIFRSQSFRHSHARSALHDRYSFMHIDMTLIIDDIS
jgi:hypothetical protein